jgi:septation ring formation regulator EzrA
MDAVDFQALDFWWSVLQTVILAFVAFYTYLTNRSKANRAAIDRLDSRVTQIAERVTLVENDLRHLPTQDDIKRLHERMDCVSAEMKEIKGEFSTARRTLDMIHEHLLNTAHRK